jgi:hypothetical protein
MTAHLSLLLTAMLMLSACGSSSSSSNDDTKETSTSSSSSTSTLQSASLMGDDVMYDHEHNLTWVNGSEGCFVGVTTHDSTECSDLNFGGNTTWRYPTTQELSSLITKAHNESVALTYANPSCVNATASDGFVKTHNASNVGEIFAQTPSNAGLRCVADGIIEAPTVCTMEYAPVCGMKTVQCITTPCDPLIDTYSNTCVMNVAGATKLYEGECLNCKSWNDGCNNCGYDEESGIIYCTEMACMEYGEAYCLD